MRIAVFFALITAGCSTAGFAQSVTPFTSVEVTRHFDADGNLKQESRFLIAVNREGSLVSQDLDPGAGGLRQILDRSGQTVLINPQAGTATSSPAATRRTETVCGRRFAGIVGANISSEQSASTIHGTAVVRVSVELQDGRGLDVYMAPSLGCHMLRSVSRRNGQQMESLEVTKLQIGDPDPELFRVPVDYRLTRQQ